MFALSFLTNANQRVNLTGELYMWSQLPIISEAKMSCLSDAMF